MRSVNLTTPVGGGLECKTNRGKTWLTWYTSRDYLFNTIDNTPETRRFLRLALERMEKEAKEKA